MDMDGAAITPVGRRSMLKLAQRMTDNFCAGVCASAAQKWRRLDEWRGGEGGGGVGAAGEGEEKARMMARQSVGAPGEAPGVVLSATTSVRLPSTPPQRVFDYLRDEQRRGEWDILANGEAMQEMDHIAKGQHHGNAVSLLRPNVSCCFSPASLIPALHHHSFTTVFTIVISELSFRFSLCHVLQCNSFRAPSTVPWRWICGYMHALHICVGQGIWQHKQEDKPEKVKNWQITRNWGRVDICESKLLC